MKPIYLRTVRQAQALTQEQLERSSGVAQNTISKLETYRSARPVFATVVRLARALDVDPMRLRFGPDPATRARRAREKVEAADV